MPLLNFLEEARDWKAICVWALASHTGINVVRQMLAWAEHHYRAESFYRGEILYWTVPRVSSVRLLDSDLSELDEDPDRVVIVGETEAADALPAGCTAR